MFYLEGRLTQVILHSGKYGIKDCTWLKLTHRLPYFCGDKQTEIFGHLLCHTVFSAIHPANTQKSVSMILLVEHDVFVFHTAFKM
jgi:hypothetical protein